MNSLLIAMNIVRRTFGSRKGMLVYLLVPVIVLSAFISLLGQNEGVAAPVKYLNADQGTLGEHLIMELKKKPGFVLESAESLESLKSDVIKMKVDAAFVIPEKFSEQLLAGVQPEIALYQLKLSEASFILKLSLNQETANLRQLIANAQASRSAEKDLQSTLGKLLVQYEKHQIRARVTDYALYVNPATRSIIGFMLMFLLILSGAGITTILEDRRQQTMARMYAAPVRSYEIMLGNFIGSLLMGTVQIMIVLLFTKFVIGFETGIPLFNEWLILEFFLLSAIGTVYAAGGTVRNTNSMSGILSLITIPTCMLGGCFWPIEVMPSFMQKLANFTPQKWAIEAVLKSNGAATIADIGLELGILALFAVILLGFGSTVLRPGDSKTT